MIAWQRVYKGFHIIPVPFSDPPSPLDRPELSADADGLSRNVFVNQEM